MKKEVLDHGFVSLVETWGSDERIIEAARMSTGKGFQGWGPLDCPACSKLPAAERIHLEGTPMGKEGCSDWLGFLTLRDDVNAQWEIRQYAGVVRDMLAEKFPRTMALFAELRAK